jgi:hypothetical protein
VSHPRLAAGHPAAASRCRRLRAHALQRQVPALQRVHQLRDAGVRAFSYKTTSFRPFTPPPPPLLTSNTDSTFLH